MSTKDTTESHGLPELRTLWDFRDPAASEAAFRKVLPRSEVSGDRSYHAQLLTQIARAQGLQRHFEEGHATLDQAEGLCTADMDTAQIRGALERGRLLNSAGKGTEAMPYFDKAWHRACAAKEDNLAVDAAHMMAICAPPEEALAWSEKAMTLAESSSDPATKNWLGPLYNNTGWTYHDMGRYDKAMALFEKGLAWRIERKDEHGTRIAKYTVGRCLRSLERIDEALAVQQALLAEFEAAGEEDGYVHEEIGECLLLLNRSDQARAHCAKAYALLSQDAWLVAHESDRLTRLKVLGTAEQSDDDSGPAR